MKRISVLILADVVFSSCVIEEIPVSETCCQQFREKERLGFTVKVDPFTRHSSPDSKGGMINDGCFGVFAFNTGDYRFSESDVSGDSPNFIDNTKAVLYSAAEAELITDEMWDPDFYGMASFFAYSPYDENIKWSDGIRYIVGNDPSSHSDLLFAKSLDRNFGSQDVNLVFSHVSARICVKAMSDPNECGHTVMVREVRIGNAREGENFYRSAIFDLAGGGVWRDMACDVGSPLTFTLDDTHFNSTAASLSATYTELTDEDSFILAIPQDFTSAGLPVEVDYYIMDGSEVLLDDTMKCRFHVNFRQGETYAICLDLTPVQITFAPSVDSWAEAS